MSIMGEIIHKVNLLDQGGLRCKAIILSQKNTEKFIEETKHDLSDSLNIKVDGASFEIDVLAPEGYDGPVMAAIE